MRRSSALTISAVCVVVNIVLSFIVGLLHLPLMITLDTVGTVFGAIILGPWYGALIGLCTNLVNGVLKSPVEIPFAVVNIAIGLIIGYGARRFKFTISTAVIFGLILSVVCPLIGTPIAVWMFGGLTGGSMDFLVLWLKASGQEIFTAAFLPRIAGNLADKIVSCILVSLLLKKLPAQYLQSNKKQL